MNTLAGNLAQPVTIVPPVLGAVYDLFLSGAEQVRSRSEGNSLPTHVSTFSQVIRAETDHNRNLSVSL